MKKTITEGNAKVIVFEAEKISKEMPVFYNPLMKLNRDLSVLLLNCIENKNMQIGDPMAGTGVRAARFLTELDKDKMKFIRINDYSEKAVEIINENIELNKKNINCEDIIIKKQDANIFLLESSGFDYIDVDPFGTPNPFLESAIVRISRNGILAVTATDTAALCGTYPKTCRRNYFSEPLRNEHMHEIGLRILIRKVQLIGTQYEKALTPILAYNKDHYFRIFFRCEKQKTKADEIIKKHEFFHFCNKCLNYFISKQNSNVCCNKDTLVSGPIYTAKINDSELIEKMIEKCDDEKVKNFLKLINDEAKIGGVGFIDIHQFSRKYSLGIPRTEILLLKLKQKGFLSSRSQFNQYGIKTNASVKEFENIIKQ